MPTITSGAASQPHTIALTAEVLFRPYVRVPAVHRAAPIATAVVARAATRGLGAPRASSCWSGLHTGLSKSYIDGLRNGRNTNPGLNVLTTLAQFFNERRSPDTPSITVSFLAGDDSSASGEDASLREQLADREVRAIAMRAGEASPFMRRQILAMMDALESVDPDQK